MLLYLKRKNPTQQTKYSSYLFLIMHRNKCMLKIGSFGKVLLVLLQVDEILQVF